MINEISKRIRAIRRGRSRKSFAFTYNISPTTLKRYEYGERHPDQLFLENLAIAEKISLKWLLYGEGPLYEPKNENQDPNGIQTTLTLPKDHSESATDKLICYLEKMLELQRENGNLRVEVERLRGRIAQLEKDLGEVLRSDEWQTSMDMSKRQSA